MTSSVLLLFLGLFLSSTDSLLPPRTSFLLNSTERPLFHFGLPDVHNTTTLLLSDDGATLYVGARDAVFSLDVSEHDVIRMKKKVQWSPSEGEVNTCGNKGKNPATDCPNFVHVLQPLNSTHLYACGSYAFSPHEAYIDAESLSIVSQNGAKGRCPFSPFQRSTAITIDGELFTATTVDFKGVQPQISRFFSKGNKPDVSLESSNNLLGEPTFVSSSQDPAEGKLYFFFNEVGKEFNYLNKLGISRVAQVCKNDIGGQRILQKKWTSFAKASLLCQLPKHLPFNIVQDVFTLQPPEGSDAEETLFYGVFTSQWSRSPESAVCVFKLKDIRAVFMSTYMTLDKTSLQWSPFLGKQSHLLGKCGLADSPDSDLMMVKRTFLTRNGMKTDNGPIVVTSEQQYSRIAVMRTQAANGKHYTILFLLTESGLLHKVALLDQGPRVIEEIQVFTKPQLVKNIIFSSSKGVVYVGTSEGVTAVPVARCSIYRSCSQCVLARDPLCGWSRTRKICSGLDSGHDDMLQLLETSSIQDECREENMAEDREVRVSLNEVVKLRCVKPSNLASLSWTSSGFRTLPEELFLHSADGSLSFLASSSTFGTYTCQAEEDGFREVVIRYNVHGGQVASPRAMKPSTTQAEDDVFEEVATEEPQAAGWEGEGPGEERRFITPKKDPGLDQDFTGRSEVHVTRSGVGSITTRTKPDPGNLEQESTSRRESHSSPEIQREKSYHSELVVVSFLLAACIFVLLLAALHIWRSKPNRLRPDRLGGPEAGSKTNTSMEMCSLSSPEEAAPSATSELKKVQE